MKKWHYPFLLILIIGTFLILGKSRKENSYHTNQGYIFGTTYKITYKYVNDIEEEIKAALLRVDNALSMFNAQSTISKINRNEPVDALSDTTFMKVFRLAMSISETTHGAFDITVAPAVNAWGFGFKNAGNITEATIDSLREIVGFEMIHEEGDRIIKDDPRIMLDCSAIAKGYGCDVVAELLSANGISDYMIEIGGEIVVRGKNTKGEVWNIGISEPDENQSESGSKLNTILHLTDCAVATSGNYRNFYEKDGVKYAHTINPQNCRPVQHSLLSATVIASDCATADAFATSFMVMGADSATAIVTRTPGLQAYLLVSDSDGTKAINLLSRQ